MKLLYNLLFILHASSANTTYPIITTLPTTAVITQEPTTVTSPTSVQTTSPTSVQTTLPTSVQTTLPTSVQTTRNNIDYDNFCGDSNNIYCSEPCPMGQDLECIKPGRFCIYAPLFCTNIETNGPKFSMNNYCGSNFDMLDCSQTCYSGKSSECLNPTYSCYNAPDGCVRNKSSQMTVGILSIILIFTSFFLL